MKKYLAIVAAVVIGGGIVNAFDRGWPWPYLGTLFLAVLAIGSISAALIHFGLYGLCSFVGVRLVQLGQTGAQKLATKRKRQQAARLAELQARAIPEEVAK